MKALDTFQYEALLISKSFFISLLNAKERKTTHNKDTSLLSAVMVDESVNELNMSAW